MIMSNENALKIVREVKCGLLSASDNIRDALEVAEKALVVNGCSTCVYGIKDPWDYPCFDCSRNNHKDYYKQK